MDIIKETIEKAIKEELSNQELESSLKLELKKKIEELKKPNPNREVNYQTWIEVGYNRCCNELLSSLRLNDELELPVNKELIFDEMALPIEKIIKDEKGKKK